MNKSRVFILFQRFSAKERRAFKKFIRSPFHNSREDAILLYEYLLENHRKTSLLDRALVFEHCYSGDKYNDAKFRQTLTHVSRLMERYLAVDLFLKDEVNVKVLAAKELKDKKLLKYATQSLEKGEAILLQNKFRNRAFFENKYQILSERNSIAAEKTRDQPLEMGLMNEALEVSFIIEKLVRSYMMLSRQTLVKMEETHGMTNDLITYIEKENLLRIPAIRVFYAAYHMFLPDADETWYYDLKGQLSEVGDLFPKKELHSLILAPINYAVKKINRGNRIYIKELFFLYKFGLEKNLFIQHGELSRFTYKNIIATSLVLEEYEWAEQFIHQYMSFLDPEFQNSYYSYNRSKLHYARKEYDKAQEFLTLVEYDDIFMNLDAKTLLVKIYYETKEWDVLDSLLSSFKTFLYRKKVMGYHKDNYQNIIDLIRKLSVLGPHNKKEIASVQKLVESTQPNTERKWMMEQLKEKGYPA